MINEPKAGITIEPGQVVQCGADEPGDWAVSYDGVNYTTFATGTAFAAFIAPATGTNASAAGLGVDNVSVRHQPTPYNPTFVAFYKVQGPPKFSNTVPMDRAAAGAKTPNPTPDFPQHAAGVGNSDTLAGTLVQDPENRTQPPLPATTNANGSGDPEGETSGGCCTCSCPITGMTTGLENGNTMVAGGLFSGGQSVLQFPGLVSKLPHKAEQSEIDTSPGGDLKLKAGCGMLRARGGHQIDLGVHFVNIADGLTGSGERPAGIKKSFGWQVRLIQDSTGNVAIYWGDRSVEAWPSADAGATFTGAGGMFGTLTKQGDGTFTRRTKSGMYYDFNSAGRLQTIKDKSTDGNVIYYNYNGSNQMIRITGQGLGMRPYFTYDGSGRVSRMTLEATASAENRTHDFEYDASGRLHKMVGPELCITYFDHDANDNVIRELDGDNYRTYFSYGTETVPKVKEINLPENAGLYFEYETSRAFSTILEAGGEMRYFEYQAMELPRVERMAGGAAVYFEYDGEGKPTFSLATDGTKTYWEWDSSGQVTSQKFAGDRVAYFTYGPVGTLISQKDFLGRVTYFNYDARSLQKNWVDALAKTTYFERDTFGQIQSIKDRRGNLTYFTYDTRGNRTSAKYADLAKRYFDYNAAGDLKLQIDELANVTYYDRDKRGRITVWKDFDGKSTQMGYDNRSNRTVMVDRRSNAWYWHYDGLSRNTVQRTALLNNTYFHYNRDNTLATTFDPRGNPTYFYYTSGKKRLAQENALKEITYYTYTSAGQPLSVKDARANTRYFTYTDRYQVASQKDGAANVAYYTYDLVGNRQSQKDPRGNVTYYAYDVLNRSTAIQDPLNQVTYFYYDQEGNQTTVEDALKNRTYFYYDTRNRLSCQEDAQQDRTYFTYEARGRRSSTKDPRSNVTYFYQDKVTRQFAVRNPKQGVAYLQYDAENNQTSSKTPRGLVTYYACDKDNRRFVVQTPLNEFTYYTFDGAANRTSLKDARGNHSYFYYDALNRTSCSEDAKQARTYFTFDKAGNQNSQKDPLARVTYFYHDAADRQLAILNAAGGYRYFTYDAASNQDSVKDERSNVAYLYYDGLNRVFASRSPVDGLTYFTFDAIGNRTCQKDPVVRCSYFYYDTTYQLIASEDGLQKRTYYTYDAVGNQISIKNPRTGSAIGIQYFTYDSLNRKNSFKDEVASVWYYDYDADSNLQVQRNPAAALTYWTYDSDERKLTQKGPLSRNWYWTYDAVGNVTLLKDAKAQLTYYTYDSVNLHTRIDYTAGVKHYFEYDVARQLIATADLEGRTYFAYDTLGRMTVRGNPGSQNLYYEYDAASNRTALQDPDGHVQSWTYDAANRMQTGGYGYGRQAYGTTPYGGSGGTYTYNLAGDMEKEVRSNGTVSYYNFDAAGRNSLIRHQKSDASQIESYTFTRDEAGNITQSVRGSDSITTYWDYDAANRVTKEAWRNSGGTNIYGFSYSYDTVGNRKWRQNTIASTTTYWEYDLADQMTRQKSAAAVQVYFTYDANGNLSIEHDVDASAGRTYYEYEPRNLLSKVDFPGSTATNYFYYNAIGERTRKDDSTGGKKYTWDGIDVNVEKDLSNTTVQRLLKGYTPIIGIGSYVSQIISGTPIYPHKNQVGTTIRHTDSSQTVANTYESDAWGVPFLVTQATTQQYRFTGKELDPDFIDFNSQNRRYHYPFRWYSPVRAVFAQTDPLILGTRRPIQTLNLALGYPYSAFNPTKLVDPAGLMSPTAEPIDLLAIIECLRKCQYVQGDDERVKCVLQCLGDDPRVLKLFIPVVGLLPPLIGVSVFTILITILLNTLVPIPVAPPPIAGSSMAGGYIQLKYWADQQQKASPTASATKEQCEEPKNKNQCCCLYVSQRFPDLAPVYYMYGWSSGTCDRVHVSRSECPNVFIWNSPKEGPLVYEIQAITNIPCPPEAKDAPKGTRVHER